MKPEVLFSLLKNINIETCSNFFLAAQNRDYDEAAHYTRAYSFKRIFLIRSSFLIDYNIDNLPSFLQDIVYI
jgi:hypothetical protein